MLLAALKSYYVGHINKHIANIEIYLNRSAGIGEHSDVTEAVIAELDKLAAAQDRLDMIDKYFSKEIL